LEALRRHADGTGGAKNTGYKINKNGVCLGVWLDKRHRTIRKNASYKQNTAK
jgi:hypothetical protein